MRALLGLIWNSGVLKRKCWARDGESLCLSSRVVRDIDVRSLGVNVLGNSPAFDGYRSVPVFVHW